ncbi:hypothetical protein P4O66_017442 [Electrophorus voltai]|uniref:Phosphatidylethanolamine binding protein 4 n=1 Tax=Electrophorus voltai TaxID=2609070 RepID=A0AAD9DPF4_9TELE|nr:hypothetical protein P4O66_017442 [Electrophorus voltai]
MGRVGPVEMNSSTICLLALACILGTHQNVRGTTTREELSLEDKDFCNGGLELRYPGLDISSCLVIPKDVRERISMEWAAPDVQLTSADQKKNYVFMMVDPDAPSRANPTRSYWRHWLLVDIKVYETYLKQPPSSSGEGDLCSFQKFTDMFVPIMCRMKGEVTDTEKICGSLLCQALVGTVLLFKKNQAHVALYPTAPPALSEPRGLPGEHLRAELVAATLADGLKAGEAFEGGWGLGAANGQLTGVGSGRRGTAGVWREPVRRSPKDSEQGVREARRRGGGRGSRLGLGDVEGTVLSEYAGPTPPQGTGFHRYQFLLYEQGAGQVPKLSEQEGSSRGNWDLQAFVEKFGLVGPVASLQFLTQNYKD